MLINLWSVTYYFISWSVGDVKLLTCLSNSPGIGRLEAGITIGVEEGYTPYGFAILGLIDIQRGTFSQQDKVGSVHQCRDHADIRGRFREVTTAVKTAGTTVGAGCQVDTLRVSVSCTSGSCWDREWQAAL